LDLKDIHLKMLKAKNRQGVTCSSPSVLPCHRCHATFDQGEIKKTSLLGWHKKRAASILDSALQTIYLERFDFRIPRLWSVRL